MYNIGDITRELQTRFRLFTTDDAEGQANLATPLNIALLLGALQAVTDAVSERLREIRTGVGLPVEADFQIAASLMTWKVRLDEYKESVSKAMPNDRQAILWDVTAPLLLGFYGGENSTEPQRAIDAVTPFVLANQLQVSDAWQSERWDLFLRDLEEGAKEVVSDSVLPVAVLAGAAVAAVVVWKVFF